jgi:hypothetical protein
MRETAAFAITSCHKKNLRIDHYCHANLLCVSVWQIYNIPQIRFRIIPEELWRGDRKIMTKKEFREIYEVWAELKTIFDEIDRLNDSASIKGIEVSGTNAIQRGQKAST